MAIPKAYQNKEFDNKQVKLQPQGEASPTCEQNLKRSGFVKYAFANFFIFLLLIFLIIKFYSLFKNIEKNSLLDFEIKIPFKIGKTAVASTPSKTASNDKSSTLQNSQPPVTEKKDGNDSSLKQKATSSDDVTFDPLALSSENEVKLLQKLAQRRKDLDNREKKIKEEEIKIQIIKKKQNEEFENMKKLKATLEGLLDQVDKGQKNKIINLVKIYENMKPKNAAQIFDKLDLSVLKNMASLMNQKKFSAILDYMSVNKAKELTSLLANEKNPFEKQAA